MPSGRIETASADVRSRHVADKDINKGRKFMTSQFHIGTALVALILCTCDNVAGQVPSNRKIDPAVVQLGSGFVSDHVQVNGTTLHFVRGGTGAPIILIHGFPQDWFEYHAIMPRKETFALYSHIQFEVRSMCRQRQNSFAYLA
jgi:hypothetical protein